MRLTSLKSKIFKIKWVRHGSTTHGRYDKLDTFGNKFRLCMYIKILQINKSRYSADKVECLNINPEILECDDTHLCLWSSKQFHFGVIKSIVFFS